MDGDRDLPIALAQRDLQVLQHAQVTLECVQVPLRPQRILQSLQISRRIVHVRLLDLDVVQMDDGIERDRPCVRRLAHDLPMYLTTGRHIDDEVARDSGRAGQAMSRGQGPAACVTFLGRTQRTQVLGA